MKDKIENAFNSGFIKENAFKIIELTKEKCIMEYTIKEDGLNPYGIVHGGILFGLADTCAGALATMSEKLPLTTSANMNYLSKSTGKKLIATSTILKEGNKIGYYNVEIIDDKKVLVASASVNMYFTNYPQ
jgi:acyl-CoA thioesterase